MITPVIGKGPVAIEHAIAFAQVDPGGVLGPWLMALVGLTFMMGTLSLQAWKYFSTFGFESIGYFGLVVGSCLLSVGQWVVVQLIAWDWFVAHYGDWRTVVDVPWPVWTEPIIAQFTVFVAQVFFAHRCFTLYRRNKLIFLGLFLAMLASLAMFTMVGVALAIDPYNWKLDARFTIPALCINLTTDLSITFLTLYKLGWNTTSPGKFFSANTNEVLRRLRNLTIEAAVPPALCAVCNMAFFLALGRKNIIFTFFNIMTPRFYIFTLMFTLNARSHIRRKFNSPNSNSDDESRVGTSFEFTRMNAPRRKSLQTETHRTTILFATMATPSFDASISGVDAANPHGMGAERPRSIILPSRLRRNSEPSLPLPTTALNLT